MQRIYMTKVLTYEGYVRAKSPAWFLYLRKHNTEQRPVCEHLQ